MIRCFRFSFSLWFLHKNHYREIIDVIKKKFGLFGGMSVFFFSWFAHLDYVKNDERTAQDNRFV